MKKLILALIIGISIGIIFVNIIYEFPEFELLAIITISSIIFILSAFLMHLSTNIFNLKQLTIPGFFYITYIFMIFIPSIYVFSEMTNYNKYFYLFSTESVLITIPLGIISANIILKFKPKEIKRFFAETIENLKPSFHFEIIFIALFLLSLFIMLLYMYEVKTIPLFYMLSHPGELNYLGQLREESFKLLGGPFIYLYAWLRNLLFPILILLSFGFYLTSKRRKWGLMFFLSLLFGLLYASLSIAKAPVASIILMLLIFMYIFKAGNLSKKIILIFVLLIFSFPIIVMYMISIGSGWSFSLIIEGLWRRLFIVPAEVLYYYFEIFPDQIGYLYGGSIDKLSWLIGQEFFDVPNFVFRYMMPWGLESGSANAAFIGNLYVDFGLTGVLIGSFLVGLIMQSIQIYIFRTKKTVLTLVLYAYFIHSFWMLNSIPFTVLLLTNGVILALILPLVIRLVENFLKKSTDKKHFMNGDHIRGD